MEAQPDEEDDDTEESPRWKVCFGKVTRAEVRNSVEKRRKRMLKFLSESDERDGVLALRRTLGQPTKAKGRG
jgi:hypothetical protein